MKLYRRSAKSDFIVLVFLTLVIVFSSGWGWFSSPEEIDAVPIVTRMLSENGAVSYSRETKCPAKIREIYFGYNRDGKLINAVAVKPFSTYGKVTGIIMIGYKEKDIIVQSVKIPDAKNISSESKRKKLQQALKDITGKVLADNSSKWKNIQAVTGATRYYSKIYINFNIIAKYLLAEMQKNPKLKRVPLKK